MDSIAIMILTTPIFFPIMTSLGFDPIWYGVIMVVVLEIGLIKPPVGLNVFVIRGVAGDVPVSTVFKGILPFIGACIAALILFIIFPGVTLFIPNLMRKNHERARTARAPRLFLFIFSRRYCRWQ